MASITQEDIIAVNDVISICKDAEEGFHGAAKAVDRSDLKKLFEEYSSQRGAFAKELQAGVDRLYGDAERPTGTAGKLHAGWMSVKGTFTGNSARSILEETERGEDLSIKRYQEAIARTALPDEIRMILGRQYERVQEAHRHIRELRDQAAQ